MIAAAIGLRSAAAPTAGAVAPSAAAIRLAARGKSPATWNRYASALTRWEVYAAAEGTPFLPADPAHFANFLAESAVGALGNTQTKQRSCGIHALSVLANVPSPLGDGFVCDVRSGLRRTLRGTRGRARPVFSYELPAAANLPSPPSGRGGGPRRLSPGGAVAPASVRKRAQAQALRCAAILEAAGLRFDDIVEGQIGDAVVLPNLIDLSIFGSKTDSGLTGQAAVIPVSSASNSGSTAFLEGIRLGLQRLNTLPPDVLGAVANRFRASLSLPELGQGSVELASWPEDVRALAAPLYAAGLPVHCLPIYGQWQHERLHAQSDLGAPVTRSVFLALCGHALAASGVSVDGLGAHSFRRGRAVELFHGNASRETVTEVLRHRSLAATRPYLTDSARLIALASAMTAAERGSGGGGGRGPALPGGQGPDGRGSAAPLGTGRYDVPDGRQPTGTGACPPRSVQPGRGHTAAAAYMRQPLAGRGLLLPRGGLASQPGGAVGPGVATWPYRQSGVPASNQHTAPRLAVRGLPVLPAGDGAWPRAHPGPRSGRPEPGGAAPGGALRQPFP